MPDPTPPPPPSPSELLARSAVAGRWWAELVETALRQAFGEAASDEGWAIVVPGVGVAVAGFVAGAVGTGKVHLVAVEPPMRGRGRGAALVEAAVRTLAERGARLVVAEMPDDPTDAALVAGRAALERGGFAEEARVRDLFRDGVDLVVLRCALPS